MRSLALLSLLLALLRCSVVPAWADEEQLMGASAQRDAAEQAGTAEHDATNGDKQENERRPRYEIYFDARMGAEAGSHLLSAAVSLMGGGEERLFSPFDPGTRDADGAQRFPTSAGVALRTLRTIVWDAPIAWWFGIMQHELFGHGGRAREFGADPSVHMGSPWSGRGSYASYDTTGLSTEELLYITAGGVEANGYAATFLERRVVAGVRMRPIDLLFLVSNRWVLSDYVLRTTPDPADNPAGFYGEFSGGGDVAHYIDDLLQLNGVPVVVTPNGVNAPVQREYEQLERQAIWNALDPGVWWALASMVKMVAQGDGAAPVALPRWGRYRFLPTLSAQWTPSGGQVSLEWITAREGSSRWFSVIVRRGDGPSGPFGSIGGASDDRFRVGPFWMGGIAEVWHNPLNGLGAGGRLRSRVARGRCRGFFFDVGMKSQGYWVGQPARAGLFGGVGFDFTRR